MTSRAKVIKARRFGHRLRPMPLKHRREQYIDSDDWVLLAVHTRKFFVRL